ncbi:MAG: polysaccharide biosynthesis/export family protein [Candidatus Eisenbacteria bacterium]
MRIVTSESDTHGARRPATLLRGGPLGRAIGRWDAVGAAKCLPAFAMVISLAVGGCAPAGTGLEGPGSGTLRVEDIKQPEEAGVWESGQDRIGWESDVYRLQPGDEIEVLVMYNTDLSTITRVLPDGSVSVPVIGQVRAATLTPGELADAIAERLSEYLVDPKVSIIIKRLAGNNVFVFGEVKTPGAFEMPGQISVTQAIAKAGGPTNVAKLGSVLVIRRTSPETITGVRVNVGSLLANKPKSGDMVLRAYDIVYVPSTFIGKVDNFLEQFFTRTSSPWLWYVWMRTAIDWGDKTTVSVPLSK